MFCMIKIIRETAIGDKALQVCLAPKPSPLGRAPLWGGSPLAFATLTLCADAPGISPGLLGSPEM